MGKGAKLGEQVKDFCERNIEKILNYFFAIRGHFLNTVY